MTDDEICKAVAKRLREFGWQQNSGGSMEGPNCLMGAVVFADGLEGSFDEIDAVRKKLGLTGYGMVAYNDFPGRTVEEILAKLEA